MWKLSILLLLVVNLVAVGNNLTPTEKPTDAELWTWWSNLTQPEQLAELRKLDNVEHAIPEVSGLDLVPMLLKGGDLVLTLQSPVKIKIDYLEYAVTFPDQVIKGFYNPQKHEQKILPALAWVGIGAAAGATIILLLRG